MRILIATLILGCVGLNSPAWALNDHSCTESQRWDTTIGRCVTVGSTLNSLAGGSIENITAASDRTKLTGSTTLIGDFGNTSIEGSSASYTSKNPDSTHVDGSTSHISGS